MPHLKPSERSGLVAICLVALLSACATTPPSEPSHAQEPATSSAGATELAYGLQPTVVGSEDLPEIHDPLEQLNRWMFAFNDKAYRYALIPFSRGYTRITPDPVKSSVANFFHNLKEPFSAINHLAQADFAGAGTDISRFLVNSTVGVLGLFDPADHWLEIEENRTTFADTLASYHVGRGAYLVLPLQGASDMRGGASSLATSLTSPIRYLTENPNTLLISVFGSIQENAPNFLRYRELYDEADDAYLFFRNLYLQSQLRDEQYGPE